MVNLKCRSPNTSCIFPNIKPFPDQSLFKNIGIDIQEITEKPKKLFSKFGNSHHTDLSKEKCTLIWSIKESAFKYHEIGNVDFRKDIYIPSFMEKEKGKLKITFKNKVTLSAFYKRINNYYLSYVCNYK